MKYGIYDNDDHVWLGNNDTETGPKLFDDHRLAMVARDVVRLQLGVIDVGRIVVREFTETHMVKRDEVPLKMDTHTALSILEGDEIDRRVPRRAT